MRIEWIALAAALTGCGISHSGVSPGSDAARGQSAMVRYGCGTCHTVEDIPTARGLVGPPLTGFRNRTYIAGMLPNSTGNLQRWIRNPKDVNPGTAMPALGVSDRDAADIAAYIYSIP